MSNSKQEEFSMNKNNSTTANILDNNSINNIQMLLAESRKFSKENSYLAAIGLSRHSLQE